MKMSEPSPLRSAKKKRIFIHRQAREMAKRVVDKCNEEMQNGCLSFPLDKPLDRANFYTGLSSRTLALIQSKSKLEPLLTPSKKGRPKKIDSKLTVANFDRSIIHRIIEEFYLTDKIIPTSEKLLAAIKEKIEFPLKVASLRNLLKEMGYKWLRCRNKGRILVENPAVLFARTVYLREIRQYRQDKRNIIFLGELWIDNKLNFQKCWNPSVYSSHKLILVHAGSRRGFVKKSKLLFNTGNTSGDYHGQMNFITFEKWVSEMLIPNLPPKSIVVMDNAPYHSIQENKVPTKSSTKSVMLEWLSQNNVEVSHSMRKQELYSLVEAHKPSGKMYKIDILFRSHGHDVVRLPPYMSDLNPIELVWAKLKRVVRYYSASYKSKLSLDGIRECTELALGQITDEDWCGFDDQVIKIEEQYWQRDALIEDALETFLLEDGDSEESDCDSDMSIILESDEEGNWEANKVIKTEPNDEVMESETDYEVKKEMIDIDY